MSGDDRLQSFEAFWPFYVGEHRSPTNRALHYIGTTGALTLLVLASLQASFGLFCCAMPLGYGFAWIGHFRVEHNRPATFTYPLWSLFGDLKMLSYGLTGRMGGEVERLYGSRHPAPDAPLLLDQADT